jgi:carotenoid cleavage dioxygenase-like enzyme
VWSPGDDAVVGEPLFVPRPGGSVREGHIVVCVSRPAEERTHLVILDAANVGAGPCATVRMPLLPLGFHGTSSMA